MYNIFQQYQSYKFYLCWVDYCLSRCKVYIHEVTQNDIAIANRSVGGWGILQGTAANVAGTVVSTATVAAGAAAAALEVGKSYFC